MKLLTPERAREVIAIPLLDLREHTILEMRAKCKHQYQKLPLEPYFTEIMRKKRCLVCGRIVFADKYERETHYRR